MAYDLARHIAFSTTQTCYIISSRLVALNALTGEFEKYQHDFFTRIDLAYKCYNRLLNLPQYYEVEKTEVQLPVFLFKRMIRHLPPENLDKEIFEYLPQL